MYMESPRLTALIRYPLKSGRGEAMTQALLGPRGLEHDRRWMVVDEHGQFLTARTHPALLGVQVDAGLNGALTLVADGQSSCVVAAPHPDTDPMPVVVWGTQTQGLPLGRVADEWITARVGVRCRVVFMPDAVTRAVDPGHSQPGDIVSFADGFPLLLTHESTLDLVNDRLDPPVPMSCFRPNLVVAGFEPFAELQWSRIRVGAVELENGGPCVRCQLTTRDPMTGARRTDGEPLRTLAHRHKLDDKVVFGINLIPRSLGPISVGDPVDILA